MRGPLSIQRRVNAVAAAKPTRIGERQHPHAHFRIPMHEIYQANT
jgi:hypothetical protein